jgi:hypothetical protein
MIPFPFLKVVKKNVIKITITPTANFVAGINITFSSGMVTIDWKDGSAPENFTSGVEKLHTYVNAGTYIAEISGSLANITKFIADSCRIIFISGIRTGLLTQLNINSNLYSGILDLSNAPISGTLLAYTQSLDFNILFATSGNAIIINTHIGSSHYKGIVDFSNVPLGGGFIANGNPLATGFIFSPVGNTPFLSLNLSGCNYGYINFLNTRLSINNSLLQLQNNAMTASVVNHILVDLDSVNIGGYTGRTINIGGTNADPDSSSGGYNGLAAKASLEAKGFTVTIT